jgi:hypothetical protein
MAPEVVRARRHILRFRGSAALLVRLWFVAGSAEGSAASREPMVLRADPQAIRMAVDLVNSLNCRMNRYSVRHMSADGGSISG